MKFFQDGKEGKHNRINLDCTQLTDASETVDITNTNVVAPQML